MGAFIIRDFIIGKSQRVILKGAGRSISRSDAAPAPEASEVIIVPGPPPLGAQGGVAIELLVELH